MAKWLRFVTLIPTGQDLSGAISRINRSKEDLSIISHLLTPDKIVSSIFDDRVPTGYRGLSNPMTSIDGVLRHGCTAAAPLRVKTPARCCPNFVFGICVCFWL
jgi:hypothetical protein